ncbi:MAG: hypothetical protein JO056_10700 [Alphaproteobacteria bacterium]|nr:hypothetical protein [Alphaproteobacteria bacterium]
MVGAKWTAVAAALLVSPAANADVSISNKPTQNMSCDSGVCMATAPNAILNVFELQNMLAGGDVAVKTGSIAKDIDIHQPLTWTSTNRLTLDALRSVAIDKPVTVSGPGALSIATNDGGSEGDVLFEKNGRISFADVGSSLIMNGQSYELVNDIATLATKIASNPSGFYALANSYDSKPNVFQTVPIPTDFAGTFEGLGQRILHLKIKNPKGDRQGFFGYVLPSGIVRDVAFTHAKVSSQEARSVGILAGRNDGNISHVVTAGTLTAVSAEVGGLVGTNYGTIANSASAVDVTATGASTTGGLVGSSLGEITLSNASGTVFGGAGVGGLAGGASNVSMSFSTGNVIGGPGTSVIGGLVGGGSKLSQSYATGTVVANLSHVVAGGFAGAGQEISNCYATGAVSTGKKSYIGGLVGRGFSISTSYAVGALAVDDPRKIGGFIGKLDLHKSATHSYWDTDTAGVAVGCGNRQCPGVTGLSTQEFVSALPDEFDGNIWGQSPNINNGYPYLLANPPR